MRNRFFKAGLALGCAATFIGLESRVLAQNGDKQGEEQPPVPEHLRLPPSPPLTPAQALAAFKIQPGYRIELVASEPLVEAPVAMEFDHSGRLYVLEMRGFMPNVDGKGEDEPLGRVSILEDMDGDGVMDKATRFVEGLVMPRAICLVQDGLLVAEPPKLWLFQDSDGDGKADVKTEVVGDYGSRANPEHTSNGLMKGLDNWIYSANHTVRYRYHGDASVRQEPTVFRGQWGITTDDAGRLFFNSNSDQLRGDLLPAELLTRNKSHRGPFGVNYAVARDQTVWPGRINPGVNRGYQKGTLKEDGRLNRFTGACGPLIYRGDWMPGLRGDAFVCEPTANLVRRNKLAEQDGVLSASNALDKTEFLTSTDERFRPVNLYNGPDGGLYIVDMHRGVIQHRIYLTSFLRGQALERGLDKPLTLGRIYRVVPEGKPRPSLALPGKLNVAEAAALLTHANGWVRDAAQQRVVWRGDAAAANPVKRVLTGAAAPASRLQALWTLEGLDALDDRSLVAALRDADPEVAAAAIRLAGPRLSEAGSPVANAFWDISRNLAPKPAMSAAMVAAALETPEARRLVARLTQRHAESPLYRSALISGLAGKEVSMVQALASAALFPSESSGVSELLKSLAQAVFASGDGAAVAALIDHAASAPAWQRLALLDGMASFFPPKVKGKPAPNPIRLAAEPAGLKAIADLNLKPVSDRLEKFSDLIVWPGKAGVEAAAVARALTELEKARYEAGKELYGIVCGPCHQPHGLGQEGLAPPLVDSEWVLGSDERLVRIVLQGVRGALSVKGKTYEMEMPPVSVLEDEQIAVVLTYIRREWGHAGNPVADEVVAKIRAATESRQEAWTEKDLLAIP